MIPATVKSWPKSGYPQRRSMMGLIEFQGASSSISRARLRERGHSTVPAGCRPRHDRHVATMQVAPPPKARAESGVLHTASGGGWHGRGQHRVGVIRVIEEQITTLRPYNGRYTGDHRSIFRARKCGDDHPCIKRSARCSASQGFSWCLNAGRAMRVRHSGHREGGATRVRADSRVAEGYALSADARRK